jgi:hypothetical protein
MDTAMNAKLCDSSYLGQDLKIIKGSKERITLL